MNDEQAQSIDFRQLFEVPEGIYLLAHSVGALSSAGRAAAEEFITQWSQLGGEAWGPWLGSVQDFREALPLVAGGQARDWCPQPNLSAALNKILSCLPQDGPGPARRGRSRIVLTELDFPSMGFVLQSLERRGYSCSYIAPLPDGSLPLELWEEQLGEDVELVHITHGYSENSCCPPVAEIITLARQYGATCVVDIAQTIGLLPIDVEAWQADFVTGSCLKWLCGGPGAGFLWVNPQLVSALEPADRGWFSHANPMEFDIHHFEYHPDAQRFWGGTINPQPFAVAAASIRQIAQIGVERIRAHNLELTGLLIEGAQELGLKLNTPLDPAQRGGTVAIGLAADDPRAARLASAGVRVDRRPRYGLRFSPHIYNTLPELRQVLQYLAP